MVFVFAPSPQAPFKVKGLYKISAATPRLHLGDAAANAEEMTRLARKAAESGVAAIVFPELSVAGYTCGDVFFRGEFLDAAEKALADYRERYVPIGMHECRVFPGVKEALSELRRRGYLLGIATSKPQNLAETLLEKESMLSLFDAICGSHPNGNDSTKAEVLCTVMETLSVRPEETVLVGDTKYDVLGAKTCGVDCIGVGWGYAAEGELQQAGACAVVPDLPSLLACFS